MSKNLVIFKGNKEGIYIHIKDGKFDSIKKQLDSKLMETKSFFKGGKVLKFEGKKLTSKERNELSSIIKYKHGIAVECKDSEENHDTNKKIDSIKQDFFEGISEGITKFVRTTVRSGQRVEFDGNIVILADVNPGAVIAATGNIVVLGTLRGVAHAGCDGNREAIIAAYKLQSSQLRISDIISRCPDDEVLPPEWPEIAKINNGIVIIEPFLPKK